MPTYEYVCRACGHEFELFQQMSAPVKRKCPECAKLKLERLIGTGAGVIFKGGGFYETDYRSDSYRKGAEAEKKSAEPKKAEGDGAAKKADASTSSDAAKGNGAASKAKSDGPAKKGAKD